MGDGLRHALSEIVLGDAKPRFRLRLAVWPEPKTGFWVRCRDIKVWGDIAGDISVDILGGGTSLGTTGIQHIIGSFIRQPLLESKPENNPGPRRRRLGQDC